MNIFVDIDNIIADFEGAFRRYLNKKKNKCLKQVNINEFEFYKCFGISKEEEKNIHQEFVEKGGYRKLKRIKGCKKGIKKLKNIGEVYLITARPCSLRTITLDWLKHNGIDIREDHLIFSKNKADNKYAIDLIVEDRWEDALELADKGNAVILLDYPWNKKSGESGNIENYRNILRVYSWKDIITRISETADEKREDVEKESAIMNIWEESIKVQMHFNEMIMRNRITFASIIIAAFGAALAIQKLYPSSTDSGTQLSNVILIITIIGIASYAWVDIAYYYKLLVGAVKFTEKLDKKYKGFGLTSSITKEIKHGRAGWTLFVYYLIIIVGLLLTLKFKSKI